MNGDEINSRLSEHDRKARREYLDSLLAWNEEHWENMIPVQYAHANVADFMQPFQGWLTTWARADDWRALILYGPAGVGKSHAAAAAARARYEAGGGDVVFRSAAALLESLRPSDRPAWHLLDEIIDAPLLVLDDLGVEKRTEWVDERLDLIVDERWSHQRPTIVTTNLTVAALGRAIGERVWSRLQHEATVLKVTGSDRRAGVVSGR